MVRRQGGRKRNLHTRALMLISRRSNDGWALDVISDQLSTASARR